MYNVTVSVSPVLISNSTERSPSCAANWSSACQEIPRIDSRFFRSFVKMDKTCIP